MRKARIGIFHRLGQRVHHFPLDAVGEVTAIGDILKTAPAIGYFLILGQRVGDQRECAQIGCKSFCQCIGGLFTHGAIGVLKHVQRRFDAQFFAVDFKAKTRHGFIEQPVPGAIAGNRLFMEKLLQLVIELVRLVHTQIGQPWAVMANGRIVVHRLFENSIVDAVQFQAEENEMGAGVGELLLHVAEKLHALRVRRVAVIIKAREGADTAHQFVQRLEFLDRIDEIAAICLGCFIAELAFPAFLESRCILHGLFDVAFQFRAVRRRIKIA